MKYIKIYLLFLIFLIPLNVFAEDTCNGQDVSIRDLEFVKKTGNTEILNDAELNDNTISVDAKMYEVGDSIKYQFTIQNDSLNDYAIDTNSIINSNQFVEYKIDSEDHSNTIKKSSEKEFTLTATYKNEVEEDNFRAGKYNAGVNIELMIADPALINPKTGNYFFYMLFGICLILVLFGFKIKNKSITTLGIVGLLIVPITTYAICNYDICFDIGLEIGYVTPNPCTYDGELVQGAEYTNGQYTYRYKQQYGGSSWGNITNDGWGVAITDKSSTAPVTTTLCTSINNKPIVSMQAMFLGSNASSIDTSSFDTSNVVNMTAMFNGSKISSINVLNFDTSNVTGMQAMFAGATNLQSLDASSFDVYNVGYNIGGFISGCSSLETLNVDGWRLSNYSIGQFAGATNLKTVSARNWWLQYSGGIFNGMTAETLDVTGWDLSNLESLYTMFQGCSVKELIGVDTWDVSNIHSFSGLFRSLYNLESLDISMWDTSNATSYYEMFNGCTKLSDLNLNNLHMVSDCLNMLAGCSSLKKLNARNWIIPERFTYALLRSITGLQGSAIEVVDVTGWDLSETTDLSGLFYPNGMDYVPVKEIIGLDTWDTSNLTTFYGLFNLLSGLTEIDISNFTIKDGASVNYMFANMPNLKVVDISGMDLTKAAEFWYLFGSNTPLLETVYVKDEASAELLRASNNIPSTTNIIVKS